jgi:hypothetical protein
MHEQMTTQQDLREGLHIISFNNIHVLCGDGFMDFIHRPKSKILKN